MKVYVVWDNDAPIPSGGYCGYDNCCGGCSDGRDIVGIFGTPEVAINHVDQLDWERYENRRKTQARLLPHRPYPEFTTTQWHTYKDSRTGLFTWSAGKWEVEEVEVKE